MNRITALAALTFLTAMGCAKQPTIDQVPVGSQVQVTRQDGGLVEGTLTEKGGKIVKVDTGPVVRSIPVDTIADVRLTSTSIPDLPPKASFREVHVPAGSSLSLRLLSTVSSESSHAEEAVSAELTKPLLVDGVQVAPTGSVVHGLVTHAAPAAKVKGRASLSLHFTSLVADTVTYPLDIRISRTAAATKTKDAETIGIPAAGGAVIGAILGGKKGAAIGAAAGGGGGTAVVLSTAGEPVVLERGRVIEADLNQPLEIRVAVR
jgi:hypothetical protein